VQNFDKRWKTCKENCSDIFNDKKYVTSGRGQLQHQNKAINMKLFGFIEMTDFGLIIKWWKFLIDKSAIKRLNVIGKRFRDINDVTQTMDRNCGNQLKCHKRKSQEVSQF